MLWSLALVLLAGLLGHCAAYGSNQEESQLCPCPKIYIPVCGTDGETYANQCVFSCRTRVDRGLRVQYEGPCREKRSVGSLAQFNSLNKVVPPAPTRDPITPEDLKKLCPCPKEFLMDVCGNDGVTYRSECELLCVKWHHKPDLQLVSISRCPDPSHTFNGSAPCQCTGYPPQPVCGMEANHTWTFDNPCVFHCHRETKAPNMTLLHNGSCWDVQPAKCDCPSDKNLVCGSDGLTYTSLCQLNCKANTGTYIAHPGPCTRQKRFAFATLAGRQTTARDDKGPALQLV